MITLFSGTPGAGKSLDVVYEIYMRLMMGRYVICNFPINFDCAAGRRIAKHKDKFIYMDNDHISIRELLKWSLIVSAKKGLHENNILWVVDEAGCVWNARQYDHHERMNWIKFFSQHRHFGFNIYLVSQTDRMIDKQIRSLIEIESEHRKANNFKLFRLLPFPMFVRIDRWYAARGERIESSTFFYNRNKAKLYDSYATFDAVYSELLEELAGLIKEEKGVVGNGRGEKSDKIVKGNEGVYTVERGTTGEEASSVVGENIGGHKGIERENSNLDISTG